MSAELRGYFETECRQIDRLMDEYRPLLARIAALEPDNFERSALAAMLHSFYTGVENILKRVAIASDGGLPDGQNWHRDLLASMAQPGAHRPAALSQATRLALRPYLSFRHVFRQGYGFDLQWDKMAGLVRGCEETWRLVQRELAELMAALDRGA
ncbi:MAG: hypothetical protein NTX87_20980 [Planctomycetota bacterium]|nr:hypothetical protein [Planctomycetota bacterium]